MDCLNKEDHVGALETATRGLDQYRSLETELQRYRDLASDIIETYTREIRELFDEARRALTKKQFLAARAYLDKTQTLFTRERGAGELCAEAEELRAEADRVAGDHESRWREATALMENGKFRQARDVVVAMLDDFGWDERLTQRLEQLDENMKEVRERHEQLTKELKDHNFRLALELCKQIQAIEPDHPDVNQFATQAKHDRQSYRQAMDRIQTMLEVKKYERALSGLRQLTQRYPRDERAEVELAALETRLEAIELYKRALGGHGVVRAARAWQLVLDKAPDDTEARSAMSKLEPLLRQHKRRRVLSTTLLVSLTVLAGGASITAVAVKKANAHHLSSARQLIAESKLAVAEIELKQVWPIFVGDRDQLRARLKRDQALAELQPIRLGAQEARQQAEQAQAPKLANYLWQWATNLTQEAQHQFDEEQWDEARDHWQAAHQIYAAATAHARYEDQLEELDRDILDQFGGEKWQLIQGLSKEAQALTEDFTRITEVYRRAAVLITEAYREALKAQAREKSR